MAMALSARRALSGGLDSRQIAAVSVILKGDLNSQIHFQSRELGVLLLQDPTLRVCLIKRASRVGDYWSGDVALPGGKAEAGESSLQCAIRETLEELGLDLSNSKAYRHLGQGNELKIGNAKKGMLIIPHFFAVTSAATPEMRLNPPEVDYAWWHPISDLLPGCRNDDYVSVDIVSRYLRRYIAVKDYPKIILTRLTMALTGCKTIQFRSHKLFFCLEGNKEMTEHLWGLTLKLLQDNFGGDSKLPEQRSFLRLPDNYVIDKSLVFIHGISRGRVGPIEAIVVAFLMYLSAIFSGSYLALALAQRVLVGDSSHH